MRETGPTRPQRPLSIPLWCDWDEDSILAWAARESLSIPLWCDWDYVQAVGKVITHRLSIPLWCDWDPPADRGHLEAT